ncbi:MAG: phosphotransferase [Mesorhizobium sp.]
MTAIEDRIRALPLWKGRVTIEPLKGGLSNESFLVSEPGGRHVVRIGHDFPFHHVFREREIMAARAAHMAGFGPEVRYAEPGIMVTAFLGARTYGASDVRAQAERIATLIRRFHEEMPRHVSGAGFMFWVFHVIRDYARTLLSGDSRLKAEIPRFLELGEELERAQKPLPIIFGHNDLLPANFLDDGERIWLIDFEYAGFNTAMFDIAGIASNAGLNQAEADSMLAAYFGVEADIGLRKAFAAMQCASLLREAMWSLVSELHLDVPGADYVTYTAENLERLDAALVRYRAGFGR